jgi:hypothetical protein
MVVFHPAVGVGANVESTVFSWFDSFRVMIAAP